MGSGSGETQSKLSLMSAAVFEGLGKPLTVKDVPRPDPGPNDLVLRVGYCGICGSDLHATQPGALVVPEGTVLGHEFAGEVVAVGSALSGQWQEGERVTAVPVNACDDCGNVCRYGMGIHCPNNRITGFETSVPGAYAQYVRVNAANVVRLPEGVSLEQGATAEPLAVGHHVMDKAGMRPGSRVLVIGGGPIGLACVAFARLAGARHAILSEYNANRRQVAAAMGATATIDPAAGPVSEQYATIAGGPPDLVIECVGIPGMLGECIELVRHQGKVMVCGVCTEPESFVPLTALAKEACLQWALGYEQRDFEVVLDHMASGRLDPAPMVSHVIGFDELPGRFEALRQPTDECKVLIRPWDDGTPRAGAA